MRSIIRQRLGILSTQGPRTLETKEGKIMRNFLNLAIPFLLIVAVAQPATLHASVDGAQSPWDAEEDGQYPTDVTRSVKLVVKEVHPNGSVVFLDTEREESMAVQVTESVELTAKKKKDFGGRKKLEFADLAVGQIVKVRYRTSDGQILSIQVIGESQRT
ncbi:MAG: hypothetical protein P8Y44_11705 [Acidobacteriota bacterium]